MIDLYKNYFQDAYGPYHLISDTTHAVIYVNKALNNLSNKDTLMLQSLGVNHDYYRINLWLVKEGTILRNVLLEAMVNNVPLGRKLDIQSSRKEWDEVLQIIKATRPN